MLATQSALADTSSTSDVDLALHRSYMVTTPIVDSMMHGWELQFPDDGTKLTDGVIGPNSWGLNGPWVGYLRQDKHDVTVDLGNQQTIHMLDAWFLQDNGSGIRFPQTVTFQVSNNGSAWETVGTTNTAIPLSDRNVQKQKFEVEGLHVAARYVRYEFYTNVWVFLSEVEAWGQPGVQTGASNLVPKSTDAQPTQGYPLANSQAVGNARAQVLIYNGYYSRPGVGTWTEDNFLPYVGYINQSGQTQAYMFDSFLFLPLDGTPSGGSYTTGLSVKSDWQYYVDQLFQPSKQLDALNHAVSKVKAALPNRNYSAKVVIAIPFPGINNNWGDGLDFNPADVGQEQSLVNRIAAVQWYVNYILSKWKAGNYSNLQLTGFYWLPENVYYGYTTNDEKLIQNVGQIVHSAGNYTFNWVPFNQSEGFRNWREDSFDNALMQPNYAWGAGTDRLENTAILAKEYGLGIENEFDWPILTTTSTAARDNYTAYLDAAYRYHYQNSFMAWYQGYQVMLDAEQSTNPSIRQIYDETYQFINGTYQPSYRPGPGNTGTINLNPVNGQLPSGVNTDTPNPEAEQQAVAVENNSN